VSATDDGETGITYTISSGEYFVILDPCDSFKWNKNVHVYEVSHYSGCHNNCLMVPFATHKIDTFIAYKQEMKGEKNYQYYYGFCCREYKLRL
jgi:hypothetical protein